MSDPLAAALIALSGTLLIGFIANFLAEDYRRFRDGKSLARALAGELSSRSEGVELLRNALSQILAALKANQDIKLLKVDKTTDHIFENSVSKLGLLESDLIEDVVYVYENIGAFRVAMSLAAEREEGDPQKALLIESSLAALERAASRGADLPDRLRSFSYRSYRLFCAG